MTLKLMLAFDYISTSRNTRNLYRSSKCVRNLLCDGCGVRLFGNNTEGRKNVYNKLSSYINNKVVPRFQMITKYLAAPKSGDKQRITLKDTLRLYSLAKPEKWNIIGAVCLMVLSTSVTMSLPFAIGKIMDIVYKDSTTVEEARQRLTKACFYLCILFVLGGFCNYGRMYYMSIAGQRMIQALRKKLYSSILSQEGEWFSSSKTSPGALLSRISADTQMMSGAICNNVSEGLRSIYMGLTGAGMMFYMSPPLAMVGLSVTPVIAIILMVYGRILKTITTQYQKALSNTSEVAGERFEHIKAVKTFSKEADEIRYYSSKVDDLLELGYRESFIRAFFFGLTGFAGQIIMVTVLYNGGLMISTDDISVGQLTSFLMYAGYMGFSLNSLSASVTELAKGLGAAQALWEIMDRKPKIPIAGGIWPTAAPKGNILMDGINFAFPKYDKKGIMTGYGEPILKDFNLEVVPGRSVALVGRSGCGKTTVANLILRLYDPQQGRVLLDGVDIKDLDPRWLRSHIGHVAQEPMLFNGTVKDNILFSIGSDEQNKFINNEPAWLMAARAAQLDDIMDFKTGNYIGKKDEREVGINGTNLSGGQQQRVAIARAIVKQPKILIFDEATSSLDALSERLVGEALDALSRDGDRVVLTIAHRLSTIQRSDYVALMHEGRVEEFGPYKELIQRDSRFRYLMQHQTL